jgi:hypothetical protein
VSTEPDKIRNFIDGQFVGTEAAAQAILDLIAPKA